MLANKNIPSTSNDIKRKNSNTYTSITAAIKLFWFPICVTKRVSASPSYCLNKSFSLRLGKFDEIFFTIYNITGSLAQWVKCSPMVRETGVQSQAESYQGLKNGTWYLLA